MFYFLRFVKRIFFVFKWSLRDPDYIFQVIKYLYLKHIKKKNVHIGNSKAFFGSKLYSDWRSKRINFMISILGKDWFKGKKIVEFGASNGEIGNKLSNLGAIVTCCEVRQSLVNEIKEKFPALQVLRIDNEKNLEERFSQNEYDLAIHWGLLYHLKNWKRDLLNTCKIAKLVSLESEVLTSEGYEAEMGRIEYGFDQSFYNFGTYVSATSIESILEKHNLKFERYDNFELNCYPYIYNWKPLNINKQEDGFRRFWMIYS